MANETQTGMDRTEMKRFLIKSKQEQVNCALGVGDDKSVALLLLSPHRSPKALQGDLQKQFPSAFNTRFGTAVVDTEDDPTLVKFMLNKAVTSIARRLVKTLKGTGFRKVQILLEDGTPVEVAAEEEASDATIEATPEPDATALTTALTELAQRIADVADPARKEALAKQAREANVNIKVGNLTYAAGGIDSLRRALDAAVTTSTSTLRAEERPPPPPLPEPQAETDVVALTAALVELRTAHRRRRGSRAEGGVGEAGARGECQHQDRQPHLRCHGNRIAASRAGCAGDVGPQRLEPISSAVAARA